MLSGPPLSLRSGPTLYKLPPALYSGQSRAELIVCDLTPQPIRAKDQHVTGFERNRHGRKIGADLTAGAQSSSKDVALRMSVCFVRRDDALLNQPVYRRVVVREA